MTPVAALTVPAVTANVAEVAPCVTVTLAGTDAALELELDNVTTAPTEGAAAVNVTVPVPDCVLTMVVGLTATLLRAAGGGFMVTPVVVLAPEHEAVSVTPVAVLTVPAVTANVAEVAPCVTVTLAGTDAALELELDNVTTSSARRRRGR